jgi:hypothetical protein
MLVIGPSLPVVQYLWSFSRSSQPLLSAGSSAPESLLHTFPPCPHGAMGQCTCSCALGVGISGYHPDHQDTHRYIQNLYAGGTGTGLTIAKKFIERHGGTGEACGLRALEVYPGLLMRYWSSVVKLPERRSP